MRRWLKVFGAVLLLLVVAFTLVVFLPRSDAPLPFLEGKKMFGPAYDVQGSFGGPPCREWDYAFKGDWDGFLKTVEDALLKDGWTKDATNTAEATVDQRQKTIEVPVVYFLKGDRSLALYKDSTPEMSGPATDLIMIGHYEKGTVGVSYFEYNYRPSFLVRARRWLLGFFGQKNE